MPPGGLPVTVLEVQPTKIPASVEVTAQTEGAREVEVRARVGGILKKRLYQEGTPVKAGQPLFQIDPEPYEIALADARAKAVQTAREMARLKGLVTQEAVSRKEYDDATSADAIAQANLKQAELNLSCDVSMVLKDLKNQSELIMRLSMELKTVFLWHHCTILPI